MMENGIIIKNGLTANQSVVKQHNPLYVEFLAYDIQRPALELVIHAVHISSLNAHKHHGDAVKKHQAVNSPQPCRHSHGARKHYQRDKPHT